MNPYYSVPARLQENLHGTDEGKGQTLLSFSIVMPTFQRRDLVVNTVRQLADLEYAGSVEVIVVVDGSTDGTAQALEGLDIGWPLRVVTQSNAGAASARNRGARDAIGEALLFLDDDMFADPMLVAEHSASLDAGADAVVGDIPLHPDSDAGFLSRNVALWAVERRERLRDGRAVEASDVLTGQLSVRRDVFLRLGGFDEDFTREGAFGNEDLDLGIRLAANHAVAFNPRAVSCQRYVISPRAYLRQWADVGAADMVLARKHPDRAASLFRPGGRHSRHAGLLSLAARAPGLSPLASATMAALAHAPGLRASSPDSLFAKLFYATRDLAYWHGVAQARR